MLNVGRAPPHAAGCEAPLKTATPSLVNAARACHGGLELLPTAHRYLRFAVHQFSLLPRLLDRGEEAKAGKKGWDFTNQTAQLLTRKQAEAKEQRCDDFQMQPQNA